MPAIEYRDFTILAEEVRSDTEGRVEQFAVQVFGSPVGEGREKERIKVSPDLANECEALLNQLLDFDVLRQVKLGDALAGLLLPPTARDLFNRSMASLLEGEGLRLRLRLAPRLSPLPWEYL